VHFAGLPPLLFDLREAGELKNVAADADRVEIRLLLAEELLCWRAEHLDQSLALSALTERGLVGSAAGCAPGFSQ
jgi:hypothetical protein